MSRPLYEIAAEIRSDWGDKMYFGAVPYVGAMRGLTKATDYYNQEQGKEIVLRFLVNAKSWRGETARRVKAELKELIK